MLGDNGRSLVVGFGHNPPGYASVQSASCQPEPSICNAPDNEFSQATNPLTATGCLIYGNYLLSDTVENSRADTSNMAAVSPPFPQRNNKGDWNLHIEAYWQASPGVHLRRQYSSGV